jgi:hypothetical protein
MLRSFHTAAIILMLFMPATLAMASDRQLAFTSETIFRFFERENREGDSLRVMPAYEYMRLDYGDMEKIGLSMHLHGWARTDLGDGDYYEKDTESELLYGYLEYIPASETFNLKVGRQHLFAGIINDSFDGLSFDSLLGSYLYMRAFGGVPIAFEEENGRSGDGIYGGRAAVYYGPSTEIGVSYKMIEDDGDTLENTSGIDTSVGLTHFLSLHGLSRWNHESRDWMEHSYEANLFWGELRLRPIFHMIQFEDYFSDDDLGSQPFRYLQDTDEELIIRGGDVIWQISSTWELRFKLKQYDYAVRSELSQYFAAVLNAKGQGSTQYGLETGSMDGEAKDNQYKLFRGYIYWDTPWQIFQDWFVSSEVLVVSYQEEIYGKDNSLFIALGTGKEIIADTFQISISADYGSDPYFDSDFRMMIIGKYSY